MPSASRRYGLGALILVMALPTSAWGESIISAGVLAAADDQHYNWQQYQLDWRIEDPAFAMHVSGRLPTYALGRELAGGFEL